MGLRLSLSEISSRYNKQLIMDNDSFMKIINLEKYKGKTFQVDFDNGETYFWHFDIICEYHLKENMDIPDDALEEIISSNEFRKAKERALYLLDYRDYSYTELFEKLEKNYSEDTCYKVLERMVELGTIDDRRYAERLARHYSEVKKFGYYRASVEMNRRGIPREIIDESLSEYEDTVYERLFELINKKYYRYLDDEKGVKKVKNALVRYGYSYEDINAVLNEILNESDG